MKRILFVVQNLIVGGVEKVCWEIVNNLDEAIYKIDFLVAIDNDRTQYYEPLLIEKGCRIFKGGYILDPQSRSDFLTYEKELLTKNNYDIVHTHMDFMNLRVLKVAKKVGIKNRISHVHTTEINLNRNRNNILKFIPDYLKYTLQKILMNYYATEKIGCSRDACTVFYGKNKGNVLFNGFNIDKYLNLKKDNKVLKQFITIGRIDDQKNPFFILEVMKKLISMDNQYKLIWVGNGKLYKEIENKIKEYNLMNNIHLTGATTEIEEYLEKSSYALFPSLFEGLGIALVETQLSNVFTFYSDVVPEEANIGYSKAYSLSLSADEWAKKINQFVNDEKRKNYHLEFDKYNKYDIKSTMMQLRKYYDRES